jgi:SAM-dependent methyltransferase
MAHCPICRDNEVNEYLNSYDFASSMTSNKYYLLCCSKCGTAFTYPRPEEISDFYPRADLLFPFHQKTAEQLIKKRGIFYSHWLGLITRLQQFLKPGMKLLDVGCGYGAFLKLAADYGWKVWYLPAIR